jgi:hypothetical protein
MSIGSQNFVAHCGTMCMVKAKPQTNRARVYRETSIGWVLLPYPIIIHNIQYIILGCPHSILLNACASQGCYGQYFDRFHLCAQNHDPMVHDTAKMCLFFTNFKLCLVLPGSVRFSVALRYQMFVTHCVPFSSTFLTSGVRKESGWNSQV